MTWSAFDGVQQGMNVYLRYEGANGQAVERQITQAGTHISPTLQMDGSIIWLAWVDRAESNQYALYYAVLLADSLTPIETGKLATQDARVYSPVVSVSPQGTPWLAWAGFDGEDEEIRLAHYENGRWQSERALTDNTMPDSQPRFAVLADGTLQLNWEQTTSTAVVTKHTTLAPILHYAQSLDSPSRAIIRYKKRMAQQRVFNPYEGLPAVLEQRHIDVLMGNRVEIQQ